MKYDKKYMNCNYNNMYSDNNYMYPMPYINPMMYNTMNPMMDMDTHQDMDMDDAVMHNMMTNPYMMYMNPYMMQPMHGHMPMPNMAQHVNMQMTGMQMPNMNMPMTGMQMSMPNMNVPMTGMDTTPNMNMQMPGMDTAPNMNMQMPGMQMPMPNMDMNAMMMQQPMGNPFMMQQPMGNPFMMQPFMHPSMLYNMMGLNPSWFNCMPYSYGAPFGMPSNMPNMNMMPNINMEEQDEEEM